MFERIRKPVVTTLGVVLCLFTLAEVNFNWLQPQSSLAIFVGLGLMLCYLVYPAARRVEGNLVFRSIDVVLALVIAACCGYVVVQTEPFFREYWFNGTSLTNRAGAETTADFMVGAIGLVLVLEATRRSIGWIVPVLSLFFIFHSWYCYASYEYGWPVLPNWMLPHAGQSLKDIVATTFIQSLGVFGPAASVMFKYVFLFVVFGSFLEVSGATQFIIDFSERMFGRRPGGPAKVAVLGSGLMGSLSGSAVANAVTTGAFTIPVMRRAGFPGHVAGGITAAAASGGALMPPVMGAGAYMMLEIVEPPPTFLQVAKAALIPAILYYFSIYLIVHFYAGRVGNRATDAKEDRRPLHAFEATVFFGALGVLVTLLVLGFSPFRAVTGALILILLLTSLRPQLQMSKLPRIGALVAFAAVTAGHQFFFTEPLPVVTGRTVFESLLVSAIWGVLLGLLPIWMFFDIAGRISKNPDWLTGTTTALDKSAKAGVSLVAASACVGIIIGIVQQTGVAGDFSARIAGVVESNLLLALAGIMVCSLILGMGVPSVVCYLLMATLMGSLLGSMGVVPLAAHLFIFYFGMMSMVTPPVALAGYAAASIADSPIMQTSWSAFKFSLVGFSLPYMFVYQPALLMMNSEGAELITATMLTETFGNMFRGELGWGEGLSVLGEALWPIALATVIAVIGITALAMALTGYFKAQLSTASRVALLVAAGLLLSPHLMIGGKDYGMAANLIATVVVAGIALMNWRTSVHAPEPPAVVAKEGNM